jgi:hypothetical protein
MRSISLEVIRRVTFRALRPSPRDANLPRAEDSPGMACKQPSRPRRSSGADEPAVASLGKEVRSAKWTSRCGRNMSAAAAPRLPPVAVILLARRGKGGVEPPHFQGLEAPLGNQRQRTLLGLAASWRRGERARRRGRRSSTRSATGASTFGWGGPAKSSNIRVDRKSGSRESIKFGDMVAINVRRGKSSSTSAGTRTSISGGPTLPSSSGRIMGGRTPRCRRDRPHGRPV